MQKLSVLLLGNLLNGVFSYTPEALADQVTKLPGSENLDLKFNQFSGYLDIPGSKGSLKHIHYWLVESMGSPSSDPLAFWSNGGPVSRIV
jgi:carboxypeptidase C (cathepsin A)